MPFTRYGTRELLLFGFLLPVLGLTAAGALAWLVHPAFWALALPCLALTAFNLNFFRDPERPVPGDEFTVVSPADGVITHLGERDEPEYFKDKVQWFGVFLSVFDVHVNRAPLEGTVDYLRHQDGEYRDARDPECSVLNEAQNIGFRSKWGPRFYIRQITGLIARRIVCPVKEGDRVERGQRFGMLKFGSRTELYLDPAFEVEWKVKVGDRVKGGATAVAVVRLRNAEQGADRTPDEESSAVGAGSREEAET